MEKFKSNPYNINNKLVTILDINDIMKSVNITDFKINDIKLYQTSFIHKSYCQLSEYKDFKNSNNYLELQDTSYETMEFLGDSVLEVNVCSYLYKRFYEIHGKNEGFLTRLKIRIVCGDNLYQLSKCLQFQKHLIVSKYIDEKCNGRDHKNILEDVFESFVGALYLDQYQTNPKIVETFIINVIEKYMDFTDILVKNTNYKDKLIRYFHQNHNDKPIFMIEKVDGHYICKLLINDKIISTCIGDTKKKSEQNVSEKVLKKYNVIT
jgi:ribonuclease III